MAGGQTLFSEVFVTLLFLIAVLGAAWVYVDDSRRNRHATGWALATFLTGPFAVVVVLAFYWMQSRADEGVFDLLRRPRDE